MPEAGVGLIQTEDNRYDGCMICDDFRVDEKGERSHLSELRACFNVSDGNSPNSFR